MTTTYPRECARCGQGKPPWFKYCPKCYAIVQTEQLQPNTCDEQDCDVVIDDAHYLCRTHWQQLRDSRISECPECGEYKPSSFPLCRRCNAQSANAPVPPQQAGRPQQAATAPAASNTRRAYDHHDGEEDTKAKDKRYWFNLSLFGVFRPRYSRSSGHSGSMTIRRISAFDRSVNHLLWCRVVRGVETAVRGSCRPG